MVRKDKLKAACFKRLDKTEMSLQYEIATKKDSFAKDKVYGSKILLNGSFDLIKLWIYLMSYNLLFQS